MTDEPGTGGGEVNMSNVEQGLTGGSQTDKPAGSTTDTGDPSMENIIQKRQLLRAKREEEVMAALGGGEKPDKTPDSVIREQPNEETLNFEEQIKRDKAERTKKLNEARTKLEEEGRKNMHEEGKEGRDDDQTHGDETRKRDKSGVGKSDGAEPPPKGFWGKARGFLNRTSKDWEKFEKDNPQLANWMKAGIFAWIGARIDDWSERRQASADKKRAKQSEEKARQKAEKETPPKREPPTAEEIGKAVAEEIRKVIPTERAEEKPAQEETKQTVLPKTENERIREIENLSYAELRIRLKKEDDPRIINLLRDEKFKRAQEADGKGYSDFSQQSLKKIITETLTANDIDTVDESLVRIADNTENAAKMVGGGEYANNPRLKGIVLDVMQGEIDAVRLDIYLGMSDAELGARNISREETKKERDDLEKTRLGLVTIRQPAAHLRAEPSDELLDEYARHNVPGAAERIRRRQLERQAREEEERRRRSQQPEWEKLGDTIFQGETFEGNKPDMTKLSEEEQYGWINRILNKIEAQNLDTQHDVYISHEVTWLKGMLDRLPEKLQREIVVRLALHDSSELIKQADGWIDRPTEKVGYGYNLGQAFSEANRRGHGIDARVVKAMLSSNENDRLVGLKTHNAWDRLQDAVFDYTKRIEDVNEIFIRDRFSKLSGADVGRLLNILVSTGYDIDNAFKEKWTRDKFEKKDFNGLFLTKDTEIDDDDRALGLVPTNYWIDSNDDRKAAVRKLLIFEIASDDGRIDTTNLNDDDFAKASKSLQLAEKLATATLESSVFNQTSKTGNDELAETIGFKGFRVGRARDGRARGPQVHMLAIQGFGSSYLRRLGGNGEQSTKPMYAKDVNVENVPRGSWLKYGTTDLARMHQLRMLLLDRAPPSTGRDGGFSFDITFLQNAVVYFNSVDPPPKGGEDEKIGEKGLRVYWAMGVLDMALANRDLGWTGESFFRLYNSVVKEDLSEERGGFILEEQWDWICEQINFEKRMKQQGYWNTYSYQKNKRG